MAHSNLTVIERLRSHIIIDPISQCWNWQGSTWDGYGKMRIGSRADKSTRLDSAHRIAYQELIGPIPQGLQLDHLCRNRACCNPGHLEPVTNRENVIRGLGPVLLAERKRAITHCPQGHPYTEENTYARQNSSNGISRRCRACALKQNAASRKTHQSFPCPLPPVSRP
jgi:hypothetical protein